MLINIFRPTNIESLTDNYVRKKHAGWATLRHPVRYLDSLSQSWRNCVHVFQTSVLLSLLSYCHNVAPSSPGRLHLHTPYCRALQSQKAATVHLKSKQSLSLHGGIEYPRVIDPAKKGIQNVQAVKTFDLSTELMAPKWRGLYSGSCLLYRWIFSFRQVKWNRCCFASQEVMLALK